MKRRREKSVGIYRFLHFVHLYRIYTSSRQATISAPIRISIFPVGDYDADDYDYEEQQALEVLLKDKVKVEYWETERERERDSRSTCLRRNHKNHHCMYPFLSRCIL